MPSEDVAKIKKYMEQLEREDKIRHALSRLERIDMTLDLLQKTQVGKAVNQLCKHPIYGDDAFRIVNCWKEIARKNGIMPVKRETPSSEEDYSSNDSNNEEYPMREYTHSPIHTPEEETKPFNSKRIKQETRSPSPCSSTSYLKTVQKPKLPPKIIKKEEDAFSRMLAAADTAPKVKKPKLMDWNDIDLNYRPLPTCTTKTQTAKPAQEQFNPEQMFKPRNDRAKVFAGKRKATGLTEVLSLLDCCIRVISNNIDAIDCLGNIPYHILKPVLAKCTVNQLIKIEEINPYLEEDSDPLWEKLFSKAHPEKKKSKKETFKQAFLRLKRERENKFNEISKRISQNKSSENGLCHKTTLISEAYAPLHIRRKQERNGTAYGGRALPSASEVSKARKEIFETGSTKSLAAIPSAVINRFSTGGTSKRESFKQASPKKGALMVKTLKMLNMKRR